MLLLAKITAVTIGMVLTLNGAERPLPQEGRMQEGMRKQESCEVVPVMKKEQKIARTAKNSYDIMEQGAYGFDVSGQWTTGPGPDGIPWGIWFSASDAVLLVDVRPSVTEGSLFEAQWKIVKRIWKAPPGKPWEVSWIISGFIPGKRGRRYGICHGIFLPEGGSEMVCYRLLPVR